MSFLDDENQMIIGAEIQHISEQLFDSWMDSNLDEGTLYADWRFAEMCDSNELKKKFNEYYKLQKDDYYYVEVE